jgi:LCP family protein required for cell wall assembly
MNSTAKKWLLILAGVILAGLTIGGIIIYPQAKERWSAPLGPGLALPTYTPGSENETLASEATTAPQSQATQEGNVSKPEPVKDAPETALPPTPTPPPLCGGPEVMTILAIGADSGIDYNYGLADVIRIVRVDFRVPKISVLSMPRDLWVELPDIENPYGITHGKLNQAYFYGNPGMGYYKGAGAGPGLLARALDTNFGLRVDHYGAVNMQTFVKIVNAVGGIDLYLPTDVDGRPIDDKTEDMGYFEAGNWHFNGDQALRFARIRKKYNDFTRMDHQNMVICALKKKITSPEVLSKIPKIIGAFKDSVLTDLSPAQLSQLACLAPKLSRENLLFTSLPEEILTPGRVFSPQQKNETFVLKADYDVIRDYVSQFMDGSWPSEPDEPTCP